MPSERKRVEDKKQSRPNKRDEAHTRAPSKTVGDSADAVEPNHLGEAERAFEESNGGRKARDV